MNTFVRVYRISPLPDSAHLPRDFFHPRETLLTIARKIQRFHTGKRTIHELIGMQLTFNDPSLYAPLLRSHVSL